MYERCAKARHASTLANGAIVRGDGDRQLKQRRITMDMKSIGGFLVLMGVGSSVLYFMDMEFRLLMWIENWGPNVAWAIRGGCAVLGAVLWFVGMKSAAPAPESAGK
jgi:hypothetical protein